MHAQGVCSRTAALVALSVVPHGRPYLALSPRRWVAHRSWLLPRVIPPAAWTNVDETLGQRRSRGSRTSRAPTSSGRWATTDSPRPQSARSFSLPAEHLQQLVTWTADKWFLEPSRDTSRSRSVMSVNLLPRLSRSGTSFNRELVF